MKSLNQRRPRPAGRGAAFRAWATRRVPRTATRLSLVKPCASDQLDHEPETHVISKQRVADHGEVLTGAREVNAMLDLVRPETERIDSRFLERACGTGNFLAEILARKLRVVEACYRKSQLEYERYAVLAVSSLYGIDILEDNVRQCRRRMFELFELDYRRLFKRTASDDCRASVRYIS